MFVYGDVVYAQTWQVLILKIKLYRVASYGPRSFQLFCKSWETCKNFLGKWFTAPPSPSPPPRKKLPVRLRHGVY